MGGSRNRKVGQAQEKPHPADVYAGRRLSELRAVRAMSQSELAKKVEISFQQIQKYENARNRMSMSMISKIADVLDVSPAYFFWKNAKEAKTPLPVLDRKSLQWVLLFQSVPDSKTQERLLKMVEDMVRYLKPQKASSE